MSSGPRRALVDSPNTFFQSDTQRSDLLDETLTDSALIALLTYVCIEKNWPVEFTAIYTDHHDDSGLSSGPPYNGVHHAPNVPGKAADCWPLNSQKAGDYTDAGATRFADFLRDVAAAPYRMQTGLAGTAVTNSNMVAAAPNSFQDDGADHVHIGVFAA